MTAEQIVKKQARDLLKHNYIKALIGLLMLGSIFVIYDTATTILSMFIWMIFKNGDESLMTIVLYGIGIPVTILIVFFLSPIYNGYIRMYYRGSVVGTMEVADLFYYLQKGYYRRALRLNFSMCLRMIIPILIASAPPVTLNLISIYLLKDFYGTVGYNLSMLVLVILTMFIVFLWSMRYFVVYTLAVDYEQLSPRELVHYSKTVTAGNTGYISGLLLSMTPWLLLCFTILPMLYVIPYISASFAVSAKWLTKTVFERNQNQ